MNVLLISNTEPVLRVGETWEQVTTRQTKIIVWSEHNQTRSGVKAMSITIPKAVKEMLAIVRRLCKAYPQKKFTLDGRLVGDIGEVLVEAEYKLKLFADQKKHHDGKCSDGRLVQIKATMQKKLTFPADHVPKYYIGVQLHNDGTFVEIFNGPGKIAAEAVRNRAKPKANLHVVTIAALQKLQTRVKPEKRIPRRSN